MAANEKGAENRNSVGVMKIPDHLNQWFCWYGWNTFMVNQ